MNTFWLLLLCVKEEKGATQQAATTTTVCVCASVSEGSKAFAQKSSTAQVATLDCCFMYNTNLLCTSQAHILGRKIEEKDEEK
jgi:hypothetical protein